ncbi:MAG: IS66 family transposase [Chitinophagaceae bacterium]
MVRPRPSIKLLSICKYAHIDNNMAERTIRSITVNRKNVLFLGMVEHSKGSALH